MDKITNLIRSEIKRQYKNVRQFSEKSGIPYSTLSNALSKGVGGTSYETVVKICNLLKLNQMDVAQFNDQRHGILTMLTALDERAVYTLKEVLSVEYERCLKATELSREHSALFMSDSNSDACVRFEEVIA